MAYYRRKTRSSSGRRSNYGRPARRSSSRRRTTSTRRSAPRAQVVRIVLEQHPANAVGRPILSDGSLVRQAKPKKAMF